MNKLNFVSCVSWIPKGVAKEVPNRIQMSKEDIQMKIEQNKQQLRQIDPESVDEDMDQDVENENVSAEERQIIDRYNLNDYDDDDDDTALNHSELVVFTDNNQDPYLNNEEEFSDDEMEKQDFKIMPTDNLLLAGHIEENSISLEVKIYNQEDDIYVHHEIYLPAYPLCFEYLDFSSDSDSKVNFLAIGDMQKDINIWDLDTVDALDPILTLTGHKDSVLDLSWNSLTRKTLASVSADKTARLWDLETKKTTQKFDFYKCNVQSVAFHPVEAHILLTGDCSGRASLIDCQSGSVKKWNVCKDEVEKVMWNRYNPFTYFVATSEGFVYCIDSRNESSNLFTLKAHSQMISGVELSSSCNGCLVTASADKLVKVWDVKENQPKFVKEIDPQVGTILSLSANPDYPFVFAVSGDNIAENMKVLDISTFKAVRDHFSSRL